MQAYLFSPAFAAHLFPVHSVKLNAMLLLQFESSARLNRSVIHGGDVRFSMRCFRLFHSDSATNNFDL